MNLRKSLAALFAAASLSVAPDAGERVAKIRVHAAPEAPFPMRAMVELPSDADLRNLVVTEKGRPLVTQITKIGELAETNLVRVQAIVDQPSEKRVRVFSVEVGEPPRAATNWPMHMETWAKLLDPEGVVLTLKDQQGEDHPLRLTGWTDRSELVEVGPVSVVARHWSDSPWGGHQWWTIMRAHRPGFEVLINWHNGGLPASPDVYFDSVRLGGRAFGGDGWRWRSTIADPAIDVDAGKFVKGHGGGNMLPQRCERPFRLQFIPPGEQGVDDTWSPADGWGVSDDWGRGGFLAAGLPIPDVWHTNAWAAISSRMSVAEAGLRQMAPWPLEQSDPTQPPIAPLWPGAGVRYGGATAGVGIHQLEGAICAATGNPKGLRLLWIEQLRRRARPNRGCIYKNSRPIVPDNFTSNGSAPWELFDGNFRRGRDEPFRFDETGWGAGSCAYEQSVAGGRGPDGTRNYDAGGVWQNDDLQHYVRRTSHNRALAWLDGDPLAIQYLEMDAVLARMTFWERGGHARKLSRSGDGRGTGWGRELGWAMDCVANAYPFVRGEQRDRLRSWADAAIAHLRSEQHASGMLSVKTGGKVLDPFGHKWAVGRAEETVFLALGAWGLERATGLAAADVVTKAAKGYVRLPWKPGGSAPYEHWPAYRLPNRPELVTWDDIPDDLQRLRPNNQNEWVPSGNKTTWPQDGYQTGNMLALGWAAGWRNQEWEAAVRRYTGAQSLEQAVTVMRGWGLSSHRHAGSPIANWAGLLGALQGLGQ